MTLKDADTRLASGIGRIIGALARRGYAACVARAIVRASLHDNDDGKDDVRKSSVSACVMAIEHVRAQSQVLEAVMNILIAYNVSVGVALAVLDECYDPASLSGETNGDSVSLTTNASSMRSIVVDELPLQRCARMKSRRGLLFALSFCERYDVLAEAMCDAAVNKEDDLDVSVFGNNFMDCIEDEHLCP